MRAVTETEFAGTQGGVELRFTPSALDVRHDITLDAGRRRVFDALLHTAAWWPDRIRSGANVVLEPRVGGRFFESYDDGCGILLGQVARLVTPDEFAIEGSFGLDGPTYALWTLRLDADGQNRTVLHARYRAFGALDEQTRADSPASWDARYAALRHYLDA
ncbi:MAG: hypothetical protein QOJ62_1735 [Actinomycetota bacterium]|nr:hypothetical protein [Actinomycetota bacterium]